MPEEKEKKRLGVFTLVIDSEQNIEFMTNLTLDLVLSVVQQLIIAESREQGRKEILEKTQDKNEQ